MQLIPKTRTLVEHTTRPRINEAIFKETFDRLEKYRRASREEIIARLGELDREWDVERALETHAAIVALASLGLGKTLHRGFYALTAIVAGFLLQHAVQGWCPPLPVFRGAGFRTFREIDEERRVLLDYLRRR